MGNKKMRNITLVLYVVVVFLMITGISYAYNPDSANANLATGMYGINETIYGSTTFSSANLKFTPILDNEVEESEDNVIKIDFNVMGAQNNPTGKPIIYDVALTDLDIDCELLNGNYLRWRLDKNGETIVGGEGEERSFSITEDNIVNGRYLLTQIQQDLIAYNTNNNYDSYTLYIWLSDICQNEDISTCDTSIETLREQQKLIGKSIAGKVEVQLYTESKKEHIKNTLPVGSDACSNVLYAFLRNADDLEIDSIQIETGEKIGFLPTPTKNNFTFNGWYTEEDFIPESLVTSDTIVTATHNIELFARWRPNIYDLVYNLNGGSYGKISPATAEYDKAVRINNPTKSIQLIGSNQGDSRIVIGNNPVTANFTFDGWTSEDLYTAHAKYGSSEANITTAWSDGSTKVKAEYFKNLYYHEDYRGSVTLNANWKTTSTNLPTITSNIPGYSVCKWYEDGTGTLYNSGASYTPVLTSGNVNFYAQCNDPNTYNISYNLNDSRASLGSKVPTTATYDEVVEIDNPSNYYIITLSDNEQSATLGSTSVNATRKFNGWTFNGDTSTARYSNTSNNVEGPWNDNNTKIDARYFKNLTGTNNATVTLTANWGTGNETTLPSVNKTNYICNWNTKADGSGIEIAGDGSGRYAPNGNETIYAICKPGFNISYDLTNGTAGTNMPSTAIFDEDINISHPTKNFSLTCNAGSTGASVTNPNSASYTFSGWSGTNINTSTAKWGSTANPSTSWDGTTSVKGTNNNSTYFKNLTTQGGSTVVMTANWTPPTVNAPTITKLGYGCSCKNGSTVISGDYTPSSNGPTSLTLTGSCTANTYNISYSLNNGGIGTYSPTSGTYDQDVRISDPTRTYTIQFNANSQNATISSTTSKIATAGFDGWKGSNVNTTTAKWGSSSSPTTNWNGYTAVKGTNGETYFKNLTPTSGTTITMEAIWGDATRTITLPTVTRTNYTCGWATSSSANSFAYKSGATYTANNDVTLYAKCMANVSNYTIEHYVMDTSGNYNKSTTDSQTGNTGTSVTLADFKKTTTAYNVTNGIYFAGGTVDGEAVESANLYDGMVIKLYYNRTYGFLTTKAGTNVSSVTTSNGVKYYYGATVPTLTATLSSSTGYSYTFSKWTSSNTTYLSDKTANPTGTFTWPAMPDGTNITLTASATKSPIKYTISYNYNGGTKGTSAPTSGTYDSSVTISNPTKSATVTFNANSQGATISATSKVYNMTFNGWTSSSGLDTGSAQYSSNNMNWTNWTNASTKVTNTYFKNLRSITGTVTLYANWPTSYTAQALSTITKSNNTCGWATSSSGTIVYASGANYTPTGNVTLYARCNPNAYTITYNTSNCNSSAATTAQVNQGSALGTLPNVTTTNKVFNGWYTSSSGGTKISASTVPTGNTTYYAQCTTAYYKNTNKSTYHTTLADAISAATAGNTINLLSNYTDTSSVTFNKNLTFSTNGYTLTRTDKMTINSGVTVTKSGSGTITTSGAAVFTINGNLTVSAGTLKQTDDYVNLYNTGTGTVTLSGGIIQSSSTNDGVLCNNAGGTIKVTGGTIDGTDYRGVENSGSGTITISGGTIKAKDAIPIYNNGSGVINISNGTIGDSNYSQVLLVSNEGTGTINITGGTYKCVTSDTADSCIRNTNSGTLTISNVTISTGGVGLYNSGTGEISVGAGSASGGSASDGATTIKSTGSYNALKCGNATKARCRVLDGAYLYSKSNSAVLNNGADYRQFKGSKTESAGTSASHAAIQNKSSSYSQSGDYKYGRVFVRGGAVIGVKNGIYSTTPSTSAVVIGDSSDSLYTGFSTSPGTSNNGPVIVGTNSSSGRGVNIQASGNYWGLNNGTVGGLYAPSNINQANVTTSRSGYTAQVGTSGSYNYYVLKK